MFHIFIASTAFSSYFNHSLTRFRVFFFLFPLLVLFRSRLANARDTADELTFPTTIDRIDSTSNERNRSPTIVFDRNANPFSNAEEATEPKAAESVPTFTSLQTTSPTHPASSHFYRRSQLLPHCHTEGVADARSIEIDADLYESTTNTIPDRFRLPHTSFIDRTDCTSDERKRSHAIDSDHNASPISN